MLSVNKRTSRVSRTTSITLLLALLTSAALLTGPSTAIAQAEAETTENSQTASSDNKENITLEENQELPRSETGLSIHKEIESVLKGKEFGEEKSVTRWRWINTEDAETREEKFPEWLISTYEFFERNERVFKTVSGVLEVFLWAALAFLVIFIIVRYRESISNFVTGAMSSAPEPELPASLMGIDLKKVVLPKDIPAEAMALWQQQEPRQALALLLRASLIKLLKEHHVKLYDSDTEAECCDRIEQQAPSIIGDFMRDLVTTWQGLAYAHVTPSNEVFASLCQRWPSVFGSRPAPSVARNEVSHAE